MRRAVSEIRFPQRTFRIEDWSSSLPTLTLRSHSPDPLDGIVDINFVVPRYVQLVSTLQDLEFVPVRPAEVRTAADMLDPVLHDSSALYAIEGRTGYTDRRVHCLVVAGHVEVSRAEYADDEWELPYQRRAASDGFPVRRVTIAAALEDAGETAFEAAGRRVIGTRSAGDRPAGARS